MHVLESVTVMGLISKIFVNEMRYFSFKFRIKNQALGNNSNHNYSIFHFQQKWNSLRFSVARMEKRCKTIGDNYMKYATDKHET